MNLFSQLSILFGIYFDTSYKKREEVRPPGKVSRG
jgi:hypothetical protein